MSRSTSLGEGPGALPAPQEPIPAAVIPKPSAGPVFGRPGEVNEAGHVVPAAMPMWYPPEGEVGPPLSSRTEAGAISELAGAMPPAPPMLGQRAEWTHLSGIPDWGVLKLAEQPYHDRGLARGLGDYPAFHVVPGPALDPVFRPPGADPATDPVWNADKVLPGSGAGQTRAGGVAAGTPTTPVSRTLRILNRPLDAATGDPLEAIPAVVSGMIYPADRGVLAIIRWPASSASGFLATPAAFLAQPLDVRCIAAILLGQGIAPSGGVSSGDPGRCAGPSRCGGSPCDGAPGGIFDPGRDAADQYDPTAFPGRASGQYDLDEIIAGVDNLDGLPLRKPFDDFNEDGQPGARRLAGSPVPAAGQVRLGTDPAAGPVLPYGIPVLGANITAYVPFPVKLEIGHLVLGATVILAPGLALPNFFGYRLPAIADYEKLPYTPRGVGIYDTRETFRFFDVRRPAAAALPDGTPLGTKLPSAGLYGGAFRQDSWSRQLARYRHMFHIPSADLPADGVLRVGSYWIMHFRSEADFERLMVDGILPWDAKDGYPMYGAAPLAFQPGSPAQIANAETSPQPSPRGPAPKYGYAAPPYHAVRQEVTLVPQPNFPAIRAAASWSAKTPAAATWVSGVAYYLATDPATGDSAFSVDKIAAVSDAPHGVFAGGFGTDDAALVDHSKPPALVSSPDPAVLLIGDVSFDNHPTRPGQPSMEIPVGGLPPATLTSFAGSAADPRLRRVDIPLTHCGQNAGGAFADSNAPGPKDPLQVILTAACPLRGDTDSPSFSADAELRFAMRPRHLPGVLPAHGQPLIWDPPARILLHTTRTGPVEVPKFGNFLDAGMPARPLPSLHSAQKDREERFLDEVYRWEPTFAGVDKIVGIAGATAALRGPGLGAWKSGPIHVAVRVADPDPWAPCSWLRLGRFGVPLAAGDLQVAGMPKRSPPLSDGARYHRPPCGVLQYPHENYANARPNQADDGLPVPQPNYSAAAGARVYVRALDLGASAAGSPLFTLRVVGLFLADLAFKGAGPGRFGSGGAAVLVKIPGITTWLDTGRRDGDGPGKHDPRQDGAGCLVLGPETRDELDPDSQLPSCRLRLHAGPIARTFLAADGRVPLLVKVVMGKEAIPCNLTSPLDPKTGTYGAPDPTASTASVRGIVKIEVA